MLIYLREQLITAMVLLARDSQAFIRSFTDILSYLLMYMFAGALLGAVFVNSENDGNISGHLSPNSKHFAPRT